MKKAERIGVISHILSENPNRDYSLGYFAELFSCAKSSISDDIKTVRDAMESAGYGYLETTSGSRGGVRFVPYISDEISVSTLENLKNVFSQSDRLLGSGFLYTSDIMFNPVYAKDLARIFARRFAAVDADLVVTVETKGIGVAQFVSELLNIPLVVIRHESKVSEGSALSINYFSGTTGRLQQMSIAKRAIKPGSRAIIIDDFMRNGGSIRGIQDMLAEFDAVAAGIGVVVVLENGEEKKIKDYFPLLMASEDADKKVRIEINPDILGVDKNKY